jgi:hypothetical protein
MDIVIRSVFKHWIGPNSASTQLISIPRSRVRGEAALTAVDSSRGGRAWVRVADARSGGNNADFGRNTTLSATTDLLLLQVFTDGETTAAAVGTFFLSPPFPFNVRPDLDETISRGILGEIAEERDWVAHTDDGEVRGVGSYVQYEGGQALSATELDSHLLTHWRTAGLRVREVTVSDWLSTRTVPVDPESERRI